MKVQMVLSSSLEKVFWDRGPETPLPQNRVAGFRNETFSFQASWRKLDSEPCFQARLVVDSPIAYLIRVRRVGHVPVRFPTFPDADGNYLRRSPGLYPDILSEPGEDWPVWNDFWETAWLDVEADGRVEPGDYPLRVCLVGEGGEALAQAALTVEILPAMLPPQRINHARWLHCDCLCQYYGVEMFSEAFWAIARNFIETAVKRGVNMILTPIHTPPLDTAVGGERMTCQLVDVRRDAGEYRFSFQKLDRWIDMCDALGVKYFEMAHLYTQWGARHAPKIVAEVDGTRRRIFGWGTDALGKPYQDFLRAYLTALTRHLKDLSIEDRCWFHISDEPDLETLESYRRARDGVLGLLRGFPVIDAVSNYEFCARGVAPKPVPATDRVQPFLEAGVEGLWVYYCVAQYRDVSNTFIAMPSARTRVIGFQLYKYRVEGFLQWGYNFYNSKYSRHPVNPYLITDGDGFSPAGDCFQVYPGPDGKPEESIRFMQMHYAMNDARALQLLEALEGRARALSVLEEGLDAPIRFDAYPRDAKWLADARERINAAIVASLRSRTEQEDDI